MFSGYGQQDSQEFMSFLIDGLHEDLNRIQKKPYIENPESDDNTVNDPEAIKALGTQFRENFHARNDSVAMDLFNGFYKNTMVCPVCEKVSITFDPFSLLTLQLPIEQTWQYTIEFFPLHGRPMKVDIDMDKLSTLRALKEYVAVRIPGTKATKMMFSEIFSHKFYRTMDDKQTISESNIQPKDDMVLYELEDVPTNWPAPKKKKAKVRSMLSFGNDSEDDIPTSDSPLADKMLVPIFHRVAKRNTAYGKEVELWPSYTVITRDEAKSMDEILRKVLGRVATMTTRPFLTEDERSEQEHDAVLTIDEDTASNTDGNVNARSIESEDDIVDVSMNGDASTAKLKQIPAILEPDAEIPEHFHNLFEMRYLPAGQEMVPTGWNSLDANKNYPTLESRMPKRTLQPPPAQSSDVSSNQSPTATPGTSDMEDEPEFSNAHPSVEPPSDNDSDLPPLEETWDQQKPGSSLGARKYGKNKRAIKHTYGKNNRQQSRVINRNAISDTDESEQESQQDGDAALIRLGEGIILDWDRQAFDALFGGTSDDDMRGHDTRLDAETLPDPELEKKRQKRAARKKSGVTLEECFTESSKAEILTEGNDWYCNRCKELRLASKKLEIWTAPDILVVHLKRFSQNRVFRDKVDVLVDFPVEGLDLSGKVGETEGKDMIYDLIAVDNHYGGLGGGHYTAYAKNFFDNKWYEYNGKFSLS
jgi:ubiquitin carboxyl-terminal hydrolase 4/11/15